MEFFTGIGAQKAGTSWIYACLYEHPALCMPHKEIHFFSKDAYHHGIDWYTKHFASCAEGRMVGEFSTSYLTSPVAASRIATHFPDAKIMVSLRNPLDRAYSQYINCIKAGDIDATVSFAEALEAHQDFVSRGMYMTHMQRFVDSFPREQILPLVYEDSLQDPLLFIQGIYRFLGIDDTFVPSMLHRKVNVARVPKKIWVDKCMIRIAESVRSLGLDQFVWYIKKSGLPDMLRKANTSQDHVLPVMDGQTRRHLVSLFADDVAALSSWMNRDLTIEWLQPYDE